MLLIKEMAEIEGLVVVVVVVAVTTTSGNKLPFT